MVKMFSLVRILSLLLVTKVVLLTNVAWSNNATYITLSNQIARSTQLNVTSNNVANVNTTGYEADNVIFSTVNSTTIDRKKNAFVYTNGVYRTMKKGSFKNTGNPFDIAVEGDGYFKILTPNGPRYTLDGAMVPSAAGILVNLNGFPYASRDSLPIEIPLAFGSAEITRDGSVYIDNELVGNVGVFVIQNQDAVVKEGDNLFASLDGDQVEEDPRVRNKALRASNVNSAKAMAELVELQRAVSATNNVMSHAMDSERAAINKMASSKQ